MEGKGLRRDGEGRRIKAIIRAKEEAPGQDELRQTEDGIVAGSGASSLHLYTMKGQGVWRCVQAMIFLRLVVSLICVCSQSHAPGVAVTKV